VSRDDTFLSRWSRRKLDANTPTPDSSEPALPEATAADPAEAEAELSPEDLAQLPKVEDLTADSDVGPFLRKGVPALLRKTALRRMWGLDPAIRDYVGDARDYAYDWNVIGGVPGAGPLLPTDDVGATLARMFSREPPDSPEPDAMPSDGGSSLPARGEAASGSQDADPASEEAPRETAALANSLLVEPGPAAEGARAPPPRRHGGAVPI
jgi:hypothetical protein